MINIMFSPNILLAFLMLISFMVLFFIRAVKYNLSRDIDIFFTTLGLIYTAIILVHGWRLDPILLFSQILLLAILFSIGWENIRLRGMIFQNNKKDEL